MINRNKQKMDPNNNNPDTNDVDKNLVYFMIDHLT